MGRLARELDRTALAAEEVIDGLKTVYKKVVLPLERDYKYDLFFNSPLLDVDFDSKPMVLSNNLSYAIFFSSGSIFSRKDVIY